MSNVNYNYVFLFYDVGEKRCNKIFKICKKYLIHYQRSVFKGNITPANILKLKNEIKRHTKDDDFVCMIKMKGSFVFEEEVVYGNNKENNLFI